MSIVKGTGKCSECGEWYYTKEVDSKGRWVPELDPFGKQIISEWGRPQYKQHIHECRSQKQAQPETQRQNQATDVKGTAAVSTADDLRLSLVLAKIENIEKDMEKIRMDLETFLKTQSKSWFQGADGLLDKTKVIEDQGVEAIATSQEAESGREQT